MSPDAPRQPSTSPTGSPKKRVHRHARAPISCIGGCSFAPDPRLNAHEAGPIFWRPERLVDLVCLVPERALAGVTSHIAFDPWAWPGPIEMVFAPDGVHIVVDANAPTRLRLWMPQRRTLPKRGTRLGFYVQPDRFARERAESALHFWRTVTAASVAQRTASSASWPQRNHARMTAMLYAHDLRSAGIGQRAMARMVMDAEPGADWATSFERSALRRLLRDAADYVAGGYVELLRPPKRRGRR